MRKIIQGSQAVSPRYRMLGLLVVALAVAVAIGGATTRSAQAVLDATLPNTVQQWNKVAENAVVGSGAFQGEGEIYMSYASLAVYDAVVAIQGGSEPYGPAINAPSGASVDAAVIEAAYRTLSAYFPSSCNPTNATCMALGASLLTDYNLAMAAIPAGPPANAKANGIAVGLAAANSIIALRKGDGRLTPIGTTSSFETKDPGPGVWRLSTGVLGSANALARVGAALPAEESGTVPARASDPTYEQGVGPAVQRGEELRQRDERGSNLGSDRDGMVLHGKCDPAVQHSRS